MRVLFTSVPAPSHVDPLLRLGRALVDRGHDVTMATGPQLIPTVDKAGIRGVAARHGPTSRSQSSPSC